MKIKLIYAHTGSKSNLFKKIVYTSIYPSLTLEQLAAATPKNHDITLIDERYQKINYNWDGDLVGISCLTHSAPHAYEIAERFRNKGIKVVLGGYHPSALPREAIKHADSVVIGEAEISWPLLIQDYENKKLKKIYNLKIVEADQIPKPKRINKKVNVASIQATRGCPYNCKFCSVNNVEGCNVRLRPVERVVEEINSINSKKLFFADSSLTINPKYSKNLFKAMKDNSKKFSCFGNINILSKDDELLNLARDAGCNLWIAGFESINQETIEDIGKNTNKIQEYAKAVRKIRDHGMMISGLFMFGFDTDTKDVFKNTIDSVKKLNLDKIGFAMLTPFPGTQIYNELDKQGRILTKDWTKYNLKHVVFQPKNMTPEELKRGTVDLVMEFYSFGNSFKRATGDINITPSRFLNRIIADYSTKKLYNIFGY
jgi:radical SAM superfamily enzyme YgiQ (UPF0313 family)